MKFTLTYETTVTYEPDFDVMQEIAEYAKDHNCDLSDALYMLATGWNGFCLNDSTGTLSDEEVSLNNTYYEGWSDDCWDEEQTSDFVINCLGDGLGISVDDACYMLNIDKDDYGMLEEDEDE